LVLRGKHLGRCAPKKKACGVFGDREGINNHRVLRKRDMTIEKERQDYVRRRKRGRTEKWNYCRLRGRKHCCLTAKKRKSVRSQKKKEGSSPLGKEILPNGMGEEKLCRGEAGGHSSEKGKRSDHFRMRKTSEKGDVKRLPIDVFACEVGERRRDGLSSQESSLTATHLSN